MTYPRTGEPSADAIFNPHMSRLLAACVNDPVFKFRWDEPLQVIARRFAAKRPTAWANYVAKYEWDEKTLKEVYGV